MQIILVLAVTVEKLEYVHGFKLDWWPLCCLCLQGPPPIQNTCCSKFKWLRHDSRASASVECVNFGLVKSNNAFGFLKRMAWRYVVLDCATPLSDRFETTRMTDWVVPSSTKTHVTPHQPYMTKYFSMTQTLRSYSQSKGEFEIHHDQDCAVRWLKGSALLN